MKHASKPGEETLDAERSRYWAASDGPKRATKRCSGTVGLRAQPYSHAKTASDSPPESGRAMWVSRSSTTAGSSANHDLSRVL